PEIFCTAKEQLDQLGEQYFSGAPALVIEVISAGTRSHDLKMKATNYREYGVEEYWAIDAERKTLYRHLLPDRPHAPYLVSEYSGGRLASKAIAGFWLEVDWLWQDPLPAELECLQQILSA
ncbi:MAG: Uma2 family endonuclease, partial [Deltaproteobacteria bacterium]|nr:Uma2 family endonuclease [Deltaproteobacteria bacterium]